MFVRGLTWLRYARVAGINAVPHEDNLRYFDVSIHGPVQSPYEGKIYVRELCFATGSGGITLWRIRWHFPSRIISARRLPDDAPEDSVFDKDLPP